MSDVEFEYTHETDDGEEVLLFVSMDFDTYTESYGQDADGNRGEASTFLEPEGIIIKLESGLDITFMIKKDNPALYSKLEGLAIDKANETL